MQGNAPRYISDTFGTLRKEPTKPQEIEHFNSPRLRQLYGTHYLPVLARAENSLLNFKSALKTYLFKLAYEQ